MNYRRILNQLGLLLVVFSTVLVVMTGVAFVFDIIEGEPVNTPAEESILFAALICAMLGGVLMGLTRRSDPYLGRREAMLLVALSWGLGSAFAALPFYIWANALDGAAAGHPFRSFVDCYFEAMSGLTTTGATVLADVEAVPRELLMWRAFTHWIGGFGIVVLFVAVLPSIGADAKRLFVVESALPSTTTVQPRVRSTSLTLLCIYLALTVLEFIALLIAGMHPHDAICHTFSTVATGGFGTKNASLGYYYNKPAVDAIVLVFMILASVNFGLYYQAYRGRWANVLRDSELRVFLVMLSVGAGVVALALALSDQIILTTGEAVEASAVEAVRQGVVTSASIQTTTGFCTGDFNTWPFIAQAILIFFMFCGGCAGSTAGGIKVIRIWIAWRMLLAEIQRQFRPALTRPIRVSGATVDRDTQIAAVMYILGVIVLFVVGWVVLMLLEQLNPNHACSSVTAATATLGTLCTVGPGLDGVGATQHYGAFLDVSKILMCLLMAAGRLEIFVLLVLLRPLFWRQ